MKLFRFLRTIKKSFSQYIPSVEILISKTNLIGNLNEYKQKYPHLLFAPVLKGNAYGHGLVQVARILDKEEIAFFVVDSFYEAMALRNEGIKSRILVIGYVNPKNINNIKLSKVDFTITSLDQLQELSKTVTKRKRIHLKIDTGMHRQGILFNQIDDAINLIKTNKFLYLKGICSHFADADNPDQSFTRAQIDLWEKSIEIFKHNFKTIKFFHISATKGIHYSKEINANVVRLGIGLYGINLSPLAKLNLHPVLQIQSVIGSIKTISTGEYIGYNTAYKTKKVIKVATVPVGYYEGVNRKLSNCGFFKIKNHYCPIVGKVSMNITSIDVTSLPKLKLNDKVIVVSNNRNDINSVENISKKINIIPHKILINIPQYLRRIVIMIK